MRSAELGVYFSKRRGPRVVLLAPCTRRGPRIAKAVCGSLPCRTSLTKLFLVSWKALGLGRSGKSKIRLTNSKTINRMLLTMKGHFLPYLSAATPKRIDPTASAQVSSAECSSTSVCMWMTLTPEHEDQSDSPSDLGCRLVKRLGQIFDGKRYGEEVESIPGLQDASAIDFLSRDRQLSSIYAD